MAGGIGQLTVGLGLDAAEFTRGLTKAQAQTQAFARDQEKQLSGLGTAIGAGIGLAAGAAASAIAGLFKSSLQAIDAFNDLKDASGASVEKISAIDRVARETGTSFDTVATSLTKLNKGLADKTDSTTARTLEAIGLSAEELRRLDPADALQQVAVALRGYADDGDKARAVQNLFGKSIKEVAPLLVDLAEKGSLVVTTTTEQAQAVEDYRKGSFRLKADIEDLARSLSIALIPQLIEATTKVKDLFGIGAPSAQAASGAIKALSEQVEGEKARLEKGDSLLDTFLYGTRAKRQENLASAQALLKKAQADYQAAVGTSAAGAGRGSGYGDFRASVGSVPEKSGRPKGGPKVDHDDYSRLLKQATELNATAQLALDAEDKLTAAQQAGAKISGDYAAGLLKLTPAQYDEIQASLGQAAATEKAAAAKERDLHWIVEATNANADHLESLQRGRDAYEEQTKAALIELQAFGKSRFEIDALASARERDVASKKLQLAAQADQSGLEREAELYRQQAAAILATADARDLLTEKEKAVQYDAVTGGAKAIKEYLDEVAKAGDTTYQIVKDATKSLEDFMVVAFTSGNIKNAFKSLVDQILSEAVRLAVVKPLLASIFSGGGSSGGGVGGLLSTITSVIGAFTGGGGGSEKAEGPYPTSLGFEKTSFAPTGGASLGKSEQKVQASKGVAPQVNVVVNAPPGTKVDRTESSSDGKNLEVFLSMAENRVADNIRSGGSVHKAVAGQYGLNRVAGAPRRG